ncbi:heavy-metal-associated domain-containing protein [Pseudoalteromonas fenneropenaei]|uniref:Heavy-metal-associated domain-containing protein n=1 Tax=Pseudoalteromonas fenneropenaei TaxID=1737459 RepID=A0ABV7CIJ0_9GAMM
MKFKIVDMTCGHCVSKVTKAVVAINSGISVMVDLSEHMLTVTGDITADEVIDALSDAGYSAMEIKTTCCAADNRCHGG